MGKSSPKAPAAPDPAETSAAQTASNKETAYYNARLNNITQVTPWGSVSYKNEGNAQNPRFVQTTKLSSAQQKILDQTQRNDQALMQMGTSQLGRINKAVSSPFSFNGAPKVATDTPESRLTDVYNPNYSNLPAANNLSYNGAPAIQGLNYNGLPTAQALNYQGAPQVKRANFANAPSVNELNYNDAGEIVNPDYTTMPRVFGDGDTANAQKRAEQAIYSRLNPQFAQDEQALRDRLLNQGITQGSEAYRREFDQFNQKQTDARMQAVLTGQQYGQSLLDQSLARRNQAVGEGQNQFANSLQARQQGVSEAGNIFQAQQARRAQMTQEQLAMQDASIQARQQATSEADRRFQADSSLRAQLGGERERASQFSLANRQQSVAEAQSMFDANAALRAQMEQEQQNRFQSSLSARQQGINENNNNLQNSLARRNQYINEYTTQRNAPLNEFSALTSGTQVLPPQFTNQSYQGAGQTDISGNINNAYNARMNQYSAKVAGQNQTMGSIFGLGAAALSAPMTGGGSFIGNALGRLF